MPRTSQWAGQHELWKYCAELKVAGLTFSQISGRLARPENTNRFGLIAIPGPDTIRYQLRKLNLIADGLPATVLVGRKLENHHYGLVYLALAIRGQAINPSTPDVKRSQVNWAEWTGFAAGPLRTISDPEEDEEYEVFDQWTSKVADPRAITHYEYLADHLKSTAKGREMLSVISKVYDAAIKYETAKTELRDLALSSLAERAPDDSDPDELERASTIVVAALFNNADSEKLILNRARINRDLQTTVRDVYEELIGSNEHNSLTGSIKTGTKIFQQLKKAFSPNSLIQRVVETGTCDICGVRSSIKPNPLQSPEDSSGDSTSAGSWEDRAGTSLAEVSN